MKIITGKNWIHKTNSYIHESLNHQSIWIVPNEYKVNYERQLLNASSSGAILFQQVMTFNELFQERLKQLHLFKYQKASNLKLKLILFKLLKQNQYSIASSINMGVINELVSLFKEFSQYDLKTIAQDSFDLPEFSKLKLKECLVLYQQFKLELEKENLYLDIDANLINENFNQEIYFYIDQFETFTKQQILLIQKMNHVTILMTCDRENDLYSNVVKKYAKIFNANTHEHVIDGSLLQNYLQQNFQNLKAKPFLEKTHYTFMNATNPSEQIEAVASKIYQEVVDDGKQFQDFVIYNLDPSQNLEIERIFKRYEIPFNINYTKSTKHLPVMIFFKHFINYLLEPNPNDLSLMCESGLINSCMSESQKDYLNKMIKTSACDEVVNEILNRLDKLLINLKQQQNSKGYTVQIKNFIEQLKIGYDEYVIQYLEQLEVFNEEINMSLDEYLMLINDIDLQLPQEKNQIEAVSIYNQYILETNKKIFVLNCNEGLFPMIKKDQGLLLNDERIVLSKIQLLSPNLFEQIELDYLNIFKLLMANDKMMLIYASGKLDGTTLLPSSLFISLSKMFQKKEERFNIKLMPMYHLEAARSRLLETNIDDKNSDLISLRTSYRNSKNQPVLLNKELYSKLLTNDEKNFISPSELETYNGCPFKYFIRYGLKIYEWKDRTLKPNDFGTLVHDVLDQFTDYYNGSKSLEDYLNQFQIQDVSFYYQEHILNKICFHTTLTLEQQTIFVIIHEMALQQFNDYQMNASQLYFFNKLQHDLFNTLQILIFQALNSKYSIVAHEKGVKKQHHDLLVYGRFDRQESLGQYVKVVDYKSSAKKLDLCLATLGFNIQMLLYLDMIVDSKQEKAGVLYFNTAQRVYKEDTYVMSTPIEASGLLKEYKMEGYLLENETVIEGLGKEPELIANVRYVKSKGSYSGNLLNQDQFNQLIQKVNERVDQIIDEIYEQGNIQIMPSHSDLPNINMQVNPCTYCEYSQVCLKDVFYNENREIEYIDKKEMLKVLRGEEND